MPYRLLAVLFAMLVCASAIAQDAPPPTEGDQSKDSWAWSHRFELRGNYRWSADERIPNPFFTKQGVPPTIFLRTPDPGSHVDLNVADLQLDLFYGERFQARAKVHVQAMHRRNPTGTDKQVDADELFVRLGQKPEFLDRPSGTTFFVQAGKFPKMERQPVRLLESYGLAATSFNRFEDLQLLVGGTVGRNFYWRLQAANGNPLFIRDPNALAGDNGTPEVVDGATDGDLGDYHSGFPILYNAETEDYLFSTKHVQFGEALGYRWQRDDGTLGFDVIAFHYRRKLAQKEELTGTLYGGDIDLLDDVLPNDPDNDSLPISGDNKQETGARLFAEWHNATVIAQFTMQKVAGLERDGTELEVGYRIPLQLGWVESIQPAVRVSRIDSHFGVGTSGRYPAPSVRWDWNKFDGGIRIGLRHGVDVTAEYTTHQMFRAQGQVPLRGREALVTVRWRS